MSNRYYSKWQDIRFRMTTLAEERELFRKARAGCEDSRVFLIQNHLLFAATQAQAMTMGQLPRDETVSAANLAIMKAMKTFNPARGFRFTTYLRSFIRGEVASLWRSKFLGDVADPSLAGSLSPKGKGEVATRPEENLPDESPTVEELDLSQFNRAGVARALAKLPKRDAELIRLRFFEGKTLEEIGKKFKVSREAIRDRQKRILKHLRRALYKEGAER